MSLDLAVSLTEMLLALAFIQQSLEHLRGPRDEQRLFSVRMALSCLLLSGVYTQWICAALLLNALCILTRFQGPYNGGSDRMGLLILSCLTLVHFMPGQHLQEAVFGYLALQLVLSYFIAGWVKIANPEWRRGRALQDVFMYSAYPASEGFRAFAQKPGLLFAASWAVMLLELLFPLALLSHGMLVAALALTALFHFANACFFGLNRFFWVWLAAYPSILWLQQRLWG